MRFSNSTIGGCFELEVVHVIITAMNNISLHDLIADIHVLELKLHEFEMKYNLLSEDFYQLYEAGSLRDEDVEEVDVWGQWAALVRIRRRRIDQYNKLKGSQVDLKVSLSKTSSIPQAIIAGVR